MGDQERTGAQPLTKSVVLQSAPQVAGVAALLLGRLVTAGFDVNNTNGLGQALKSALVAGATPLPSNTKGATVGGGLLNGPGAWSALQRSQLYMNGPTRRPSNTVGTSSISTVAVSAVAGAAAASVVWVIALAIVFRIRTRPPKPVDLTGVNFRTAQASPAAREQAAEIGFAPVGRALERAVP